MLEGSIIYKRNYLQNKNLPPFDPLEDMNPEKFYFDKMFMNLDKSLRMLIYTKHDLNTNNMIYIETSAKTNINITRAFHDITSKILEKVYYFKKCEHFC